jgi:hypothetical protein
VKNILESFFFPKNQPKKKRVVHIFSTYCKTIEGSIDCVQRMNNQERAWIAMFPTCCFHLSGNFKQKFIKILFAGLRNLDINVDITEKH